MRILLALSLVLFSCVLSSEAASLVTATITVTNTSGTTNGQTITVNSDTRTWTNSIITPASQILTNNTMNGSATNLFNAIADAPFANMGLSWSSSNAVSLQTIPNGTITVTLSAGWATLAYTTNSLTSAQLLRLPLTVEAAGQQTNIASMVVTALESSTNAFSATDAAHANYLSLSQAQTASGAKQLTNSGGLWGGSITSTNISGQAGSVSNGLFATPILNAPTTTNLVNYGNAISSPNSGFASASEQFGSGANAGALTASAFGYHANATGIGASALGTLAQSLGGNSTAVGTGAAATNSADSAFGYSANAAGTNSTTVGAFAVVAPGQTNSTAVGYKAATTAANQLMLGSPGISVVVNNALQVGGGATFTSGVTNLFHTGTNYFPAGADVSFGRYALSSLANGNNAAVPVGTNVFVEVSGPSGAFTINGINGQPNRDGKFLILLNRTGQNMTIANDSGVDSTAANRIYCLTGADKSVTGNSAALLIYSGAVSRWIVLSFTQ